VLVPSRHAQDLDQGAAERLALRGQLRLPGPPPADRALPVPDQRPRDAAQGGDQLQRDLHLQLAVLPLKLAQPDAF
jgi:hypothetical protein